MVKLSISDLELIHNFRLKPQLPFTNHQFQILHLQWLLQLEAWQENQSNLAMEELNMQYKQNDLMQKKLTNFVFFY